MKRCLYCLAGILLLLACKPSSPEGPKDPETPDPEFSVSGLPGTTVNAYTTFILKVSTKSSGAISFKSSNTAGAAVYLVAKRQYRVEAKAPAAETPVKIIFDQEADSTYPAVHEEVGFTVLPESFSPGLTAPSGQLPELDGTKVTFEELDEQVTNPERGIYRSRDFKSSSDPLKASEVKAQRLAGHTLWYIGFYLTDFMKGDISEAFLKKIQDTMDALREGGSKCILRFAYRDYHSDGEEMDPEVSVVLRHVEQLKPLLQKNEDVIFVLQAGFVGSWGEWYYTTHFVFSPKSDADYQPRKQLTEALLDALPASRQIQLRTPQFKMRMYGLTVQDTLTAATAHDGSAKSRLAGHNDCFGASADDYGTFDNEKQDRAFWKADTRYTIMGGETCGLSDYCVCEATLKDLEDYHWTYLNNDYHQGVTSRWKSSGCYNQIAARMGYRLVLKDLYYSKDFAAGKKCDVTIRFYNSGFAAPMNPRNASLVWVSDSGEKQEFPTGSDPRTWHSGYNQIEASFTPSSAKGTLYLLLEDPLLPGRAEYCIAMANRGVFDSSTGYNKLFEL
ncbi:MAG: DUF4832 domain-containing protein [Bacteroidales bacterium]|nr:DUF4832 domain-containing protein [Bacteroidales bacterium]